MSKYNKVVKGQVESPMKALPLVLGALGVGSAIYGGIQASQGVRDAETAITDAQGPLAQSQQAYMDFEFKNPFESITNPYLTSQNVYEDMTIDQRAAESARSQLDAQVAQLLQAQKETGTFDVSTVQAISDIQKQGREAISGDISRQEQQAQTLRLGEAARIQQQQQATDLALQQAAAQGAQAQQALEFDRLGTIYGMDMERMAGAQQQLGMAKQGQAQFFGDLAGSLFSLASSPTISG